VMRLKRKRTKNELWDKNNKSIRRRCFLLC
jgi:hypothetical protein